MSDKVNTCKSSDLQTNIIADQNGSINVLQYVESFATAEMSRVPTY